MDEKDPAASRQRIDKWLWFARCVKSRTLAARLVSAGHVRVNSQRVDAPAHLVAIGDHLTIALERHTLLWEVLGIGTRRGPYPEAAKLYKDETPAPTDQTSPPALQRDPGSGRPTKKQRRAIERFDRKNE
ncbi:MAG: RNA-binding S4 domain-containing protein [Hyphomicrobiales bacterium]|nr:RNA-binding S4 domain-containing protein [Hyphomicrobiales bacterium]MDE2113455.1 RNA-binding S4 domain-containing protein [Hyphomicrobiales bacterium]